MTVCRVNNLKNRITLFNTLKLPTTCYKNKVKCMVMWLSLSEYNIDAPIQLAVSIYSKKMHYMFTQQGIRY